jgi:hypothetical protein
MPHFKYEEIIKESISAVANTFLVKGLQEITGRSRLLTKQKLFAISNSKNPF